MFIPKKVCYRFWPSPVSLNSIELESYGSNRTSNLRRSNHRYVCARKTSLGPYVGNGLYHVVPLPCRSFLLFERAMDRPIFVQAQAHPAGVHFICSGRSWSQWGSPAKDGCMPLQSESSYENEVKQSPKRKWEARRLMPKFWVSIFDLYHPRCSRFSMWSLKMVSKRCLWHSTQVAKMMNVCIAALLWFAQ